MSYFNANNALRNVVEDTTPQLGGDLDTNGNDILFDTDDILRFGANIVLEQDANFGTSDLLLRPTTGTGQIGIVTPGSFLLSTNAGELGAGNWSPWLFMDASTGNVETALGTGGKLKIDINGGAAALLDVSSIATTDKTFTFPNTTGTLALVGHTHTKTDLTDIADFLLESEVDADIKTLSLPASTTISTFGASLIDDANATAVLTTLGVDTDLLTLTIGASASVSGTNTGDQSSSDFDHGGLTGLSDDDHTQYALLAGRSGGQTLIGGTAASNTLTLQSTSNATKGKILFGTSAYDEVNNRLGIGTTGPADILDLNVPVGANGGLYIRTNSASDLPQLTLDYNNTTQVWRWRVNSAGRMIWTDATAGTAPFRFDGGNPSNTFVVSGGNIGLGATAFGTSAAGVLGIANGTEPSTSPADMVQLYSVDLSAGNATLGLRTETAVVSEAVTSDRTLSVRINGTTYKILLKA